MVFICMTRILTLYLDSTKGQFVCKIPKRKGGGGLGNNSTFIRNWSWQSVALEIMQTLQYTNNI